MRPLFCIDVTRNRKNEELNGVEFIAREISDESKKILNKKIKALNSRANKIKPSCLAALTMAVCFLAGLILFIGAVVSAVKDVTSQSFKNPALFIASVIFFIIFAVLLFIIKRKNKELPPDEEVIELTEEVNNEYIILEEELGIPEDYKEIEVLKFYYKNKNDKRRVVHHRKGFEFSPRYENIPYKFYTTPGYLHIADKTCVYAFALHELKRIQLITKDIKIPYWLKSEAFDSEAFEQYRIKETDSGYLLREHYVLEIERNDETFGLYFPNYELNEIQEITGITVE